MSHISIYVASIADYNNGRLHGVHIDLDSTTTQEDIEEQIATMLRESKYPNVEVDCPKCDEGQMVVMTHASGLRTTIDCPGCKATGKVPSAEEWRIDDTEGLPDVMTKASIEQLVKFVEEYEEHGEGYYAWVSDFHSLKDWEAGDYNDAQAGAGTSERDWVENFLDDIGTLSEIPERLRTYFDYDAYLRDMKLNGEVSFVEHDGKTYAFWNR
jgi:antirestriction protein